MTALAKRRRGRPERPVEAYADLGPRLALTDGMSEQEKRSAIAAHRTKVRRAAISRASAVAEPDPITRDNHGATAAQIANGRVALGVMRPDPGRPMFDQQGVQVGFHETRGARAVILYDWLHRQGALTDEQREAADRYLVRLEQASGAVECRGERVVRGGGGQGTPTERQVSALADLRRADAALGVDRDLVRLVVGWNMEPEDGLDGERLAAALGRLAEMWGM